MYLPPRIYRHAPSVCNQSRHTHPFFNSIYNITLYKYNIVQTITSAPPELNAHSKSIFHRIYSICFRAHPTPPPPPRQFTIFSAMHNQNPTPFDIAGAHTPTAHVYELLARRGIMLLTGRPLPPHLLFPPRTQFAKTFFR